MSKYKVIAKYEQYYSVEVEASSEDEAKELAKELDEYDWIFDKDETEFVYRSKLEIVNVEKQ